MSGNASGTTGGTKGTKGTTSGTRRHDGDTMNQPGLFAFIGGGARSGKSSFALALARTRGPRRVFIATARPSDDEMRRRIERHQIDRGDDFRTIEEPLRLAEVLTTCDADVMVVDCATLWLSNLLLQNREEPSILQEVDRAVRAICEVRARRKHVVLVTNEVGMSVHPPTALGRAFQDIAGFAHQRLTRAADEVYFAMLGMVLRVRPAPIEEASAGAATQAETQPPDAGERS